MQDSSSSIFRSARRFLSGTLLSRITGLCRDMALAFAFGTGTAVAAFMVAFRFAHLFRRVLGEGALQTAFIPHFEALRQESPQKAATFFTDLTRSLIYVLLAVVGCGMAALAVLLAWGNFSPDNQEILKLTLLMLPSLFFICLFGLNCSLLQCEKHYFLAGVAPCAFNLIWIIGVLAIWKGHLPYPMEALSLFVILACAAQWLVTVRKAKIMPHTSKAAPFSKEVKALFAPLFLGVLGISAAQINNALDTLFARYADLEGPAFLWYSIRIQQLPLALFGVALSGALLPPLSRAIKSGEESRFRHFLNMALHRSFALMLPITVGLFLMGDTCIQLIYGRGEFGATSVVGTTLCLWGYAFGLIPMTWILILGPAFYAQNNYATPTRGAIGSVLLNIALNALFIFGLGWKAESVAWATSVSAWANCLYLAYHLRDRIDLAPTRETTQTTLATLAGLAALALAGTQLFSLLQGQIPTYSPFFPTLQFFFIQLSAFGIAFLCIYRNYIKEVLLSFDN